MQFEANKWATKLDLIARAYKIAITVTGPMAAKGPEFEDMNLATYHLMKYVLIISVTYVEAMLVEFVQAVFYTNPDRMFNYLNVGDQKNLTGYVPLKSVLAAKSLPELVNGLAEKAAKNAISGKTSQIIKRVSEIVKVDPDEFEPVLEGLEIMFDLRNRLIHEAHEPALAVPYVSDTLTKVFRLREILENIAELKGIPYTKWVPIED